MENNSQTTLEYIQSILGNNYDYIKTRDGGVIIRDLDKKFEVFIPKNYNDSLNEIVYFPGNDTRYSFDAPVINHYNPNRSVPSHLYYQEDFIDAISVNNPNTVVVTYVYSISKNGVSSLSRNVNDIFSSLNLNIDRRIVSGFSDGGDNAIYFASTNQVDNILLFDAFDFNNMKKSYFKKIAENGTSLILVDSYKNQTGPYGFFDQRLRTAFESGVTCYRIHTNNGEHTTLMYEGLYKNNLYGFISGSTELTNHGNPGYTCYMYDETAKKFVTVDPDTFVQSINNFIPNIDKYYKNNSNYKVKYDDFVLDKKYDYLKELSDLSIDGVVSSELTTVLNSMNTLRRSIKSSSFLNENIKTVSGNAEVIPGNISASIKKYYTVVADLMDSLAKESVAVVKAGLSEEKLDKELDKDADELLDPIIPVEPAVPVEPVEPAVPVEPVVPTETPEPSEEDKIRLDVLYEKRSSIKRNSPSYVTPNKTRVQSSPTSEVKTDSNTTTKPMDTIVEEKPIEEANINKEDNVTPIVEPTSEVTKETTNPVIEEEPVKEVKQTIETKPSTKTNTSIKSATSKNIKYESSSPSIVTIPDNEVEVPNNEVEVPSMEPVIPVQDSKPIVTPAPTPVKEEESSNTDFLDVLKALGIAGLAGGAVGGAAYGISEMAKDKKYKEDGENYYADKSEDGNFSETEAYDDKRTPFEDDIFVEINNEEK